MAQKNLVKLKNKETGEMLYTFRKKTAESRKLEFKKFSKKLRKRVVFKEVKK